MKFFFRKKSDFVEDNSPETLRKRSISVQEHSKNSYTSLRQ